MLLLYRCDKVGIDCLLALSSTRRGDPPKRFEEDSEPVEEQVEVRHDTVPDGDGVVMAQLVYALESSEGRPLAPVNDVLSCLYAMLILLKAVAGGGFPKIMAQKRSLSHFPATSKLLTVGFAHFRGPFSAFAIVANCGNDWGIVSSGE